MTFCEAVQVLVDCASRWAENAEEAFPRRINADDTDDVLIQLALEVSVLPDAAIEIRDLWKAVEVATSHLNKPVDGAPR